MLKLRISLLAATLLAWTAASAEDAPEDTGLWTGKLAAGYLATSGNTDSTSADFNFDVLYSPKPWGHNARGRAFGASTDKNTTAESYQLGWKSTYDFNEFNYAFGAADWNKNRFSGYSEQTFLTAGYGRRILNSDTFVLNGEVGVGYASQKPNKNAAMTKTETGATGTVGGNFIWNFSQNASFEQRLFVFVASANTFLESVSSLKAGLIGNVGLELSYTVRQNSDVPVTVPPTDKKDTITSIALNYSF